MSAIKLTPEFQHELERIAVELGACKESKNYLLQVNTFGKMLRFIKKYQDDIYYRYYDWLVEKEEELENTESLSTEKIIEYLNSPFVSDFDKNVIREFILNQK